MTMIVGLKSGYQVVVQDKFYLFGNNETGSLTHVFLTVDKKRVITIPPEGSIEFTDEPATEQTLINLEKALIPDIIPKQVESDPNVG